MSSITELRTAWNEHAPHDIRPIDTKDISIEGTVIKFNPLGKSHPLEEKDVKSVKMDSIDNAIIIGDQINRYLRHIHAQATAPEAKPSKGNMPATSNDAGMGVPYSPVGGQDPVEKKLDPQFVASL